MVMIRNRFSLQHETTFLCNRQKSSASLSICPTSDWNSFFRFMRCLLIIDWMQEICTVTNVLITCTFLQSNKLSIFKFIVFCPPLTMRTFFLDSTSRAPAGLATSPVVCYFIRGIRRLILGMAGSSPSPPGLAMSPARPYSDRPGLRKIRLPCHRFQ